MSIHFIDGPAKAKVLTLARTPLMLRVVIARGQVDALDQPGDTPEPDEAVYVYIMRGRPTSAFVDGRRNGKRYGYRDEIATYRHFPEIVPEATLRDNAAWSSWCHANADRLMAMWAADMEAHS